MSESRAQRTLVKSPPELWSELSDPAALARHLGEFGEIRITRLEPETRVEWEGETASGIVELAASGWGTRVTLTATVGKESDAGAEGTEPPEPEPQPVEPPEPESEPPELESEPAESEEPEPEPPAASIAPAASREPWGDWSVREWPVRDDESGVPWYRRELLALAAAKAGRAPAPAPEDAWPSDSPDEADEMSGEPIGPDAGSDGDGPVTVQGPRARRRLLGRLFGWRRGHAGSGGSAAEQAMEVSPAGPTPAPPGPGPAPPTPGPDPAPPSPGPDPGPPVPIPDPSPPTPAPDPQPGPPEPTPPQISVRRLDAASANTDPARSEEAEHLTAVLTAVLDDLGSAHHRPFSRP